MIKCRLSPIVSGELGGVSDVGHCEREDRDGCDGDTSEFVHVVLLCAMGLWL